MIQLGFVLAAGGVALCRHPCGTETALRSTAKTPSLNSPSPTLGEHSEPGLMRVLGLPSDDIAMLERDGMIGMKPV